jgi:CheY-like chemotaxis protein
VSLRCLLVDDSDAFLACARVLLEREGVKVAGVASNSAKALKQARAESDYAELTAESTAAGFLVKSELSAGAIDRVLGRTP